MCFPAIFPDGQFGEFHPREEKVSPAEYIKCRLWNVDPRFRKDPQYIFFLLSQKEKREFKAGIYNVMNSSKTEAMSVRNFLQNLETSSEHLEASLNTVLQSVRGTKAFWNLRSDLECMVREVGMPTLFLTFSCAEYKSVDIDE